jgi:hypothetical protein
MARYSAASQWRTSRSRKTARGSKHAGRERLRSFRCVAGGLFATRRRVRRRVCGALLRSVKL